MINGNKETVQYIKKLITSFAMNIYHSNKMFNPWLRDFNLLNM
jgi:hypothetical protein